MIPSLLQIPSAVSDSKLHSVLPNNGKGDFTFDRSTGATRINKDGLIEEVGYFSSELVQNGNFSELGSELVTNGNFVDNFDDWTVASYGGVISGELNLIDGALRITKTSNSDWRSSFIRQTITYTSGKTYRVNFKIKGDAPSANIYVRNNYDSSGQTIAQGISLTGQFVEYTYYFVANSNSVDISFGNVNWQNAGTGQSFEIDNVSVKQVDPNDRWTLETGWSYGDNRLNFSGGSSNRACYSNIGITNGKKYKLSFNVLSISAGQVSLRFGGMAGVDEITATSTGIHSGIITANSSAIGTVQIEDNDNNFVGSITDVSVVEVQGDRPRLSYDITNGVVEDKPHLLLEPSATNLVTFSEDFSQSSYIKVNSTTIVADQIKAPDNTTTADLMKSAQTGSIQGIYNNISFTSGQSYAFSVFAKKKENIYLQVQAGGGTFGTCFANFDLENGVVGTVSGGTGQIETFTNDWYRCIFIVSAISTGTGNISLDLISSSTAGRNDNFTGNVGDGLYIWGAMVEQQAFATSYLKTAGTTITRAAETCNNSKPSVNSTEGVLYAEINIPENIADNVNVAISDGTNTEYVKFIYLPSTSTFVAEIEGSSNRKAINDTSFVLGSYSKIAILYKSGEFKLYINGSQISSTITTHTLPTGLNEVAFDRGDGSAVFYGKVKGLAVYNEALSESQLMQLTGVTASSIYNNFVTRTASFTVEALNEVKKVIDNL